MKFFSLISQKKVHVAPNQKVIPKKEFSTLQKSEDLLKKVEEEAVEYRKEVAQEGEELKERMAEKGFAEGLEKWAEQTRLLEKEIKKVREDVEKLVTSIALTSAKKIVGREIELNNSTVSDIIKQSLNAVAQHQKIKVYVNKQDFDLLENEKEKLKSVFENAKSFSIQPREDIDLHGAVIETEAGIINAQFEMLWTKLEAALQHLTK